MNTNAGLLNPSGVRGWRMGLANMLSKEKAAWLHTRRWWIQCLTAVVLLNGSFALNMADPQRSVVNAGLNFLIMAGWVAPLVAIIMGQDSILGERHSGTAAWVLSKPLQRASFILAKLIVYGLGLLVTWVVLPGGIAYIQFRAYGLDQLSISGYVAGMGLLYLNLLFYLTLALMLATLANGRGLGLGITVLNIICPMILSESIMKHVPWLVEVMPWNLGTPFGSDSPLAGYLMLNAPLPTVGPIAASVVWSVLFVAIAIWRIRREEF